MYRGYAMQSVRRRLEALMGVQGGPDIAFQPRLMADRQGIEWVMRTGTSADPLLHQLGDDWVWDARNPRGGVQGINVTRDASQQANRIYATGSGIQRATLIERMEPAALGVPDLRDVGFPLLESVINRPDVEQPVTLRSWAAAGLRANARSQMQWVVRVAATGNPPLGVYRPGDYARVWVGGHPLLGMLLPNPWYRSRVLQVAGSMGETVSVTLAPGEGVR